MTNLEIKHSLKVAQTVLHAAEVELSNYEDILDQWKKEHHGLLLVECFDNGREQGYVIKMSGFSDIKPFYTHYIAFSGNRNSDYIAVYYYDKTQGPGSNSPAEDDWDNRKLFPPGTYGRVAEDISDHIVELIKKTR